MLKWLLLDIKRNLKSKKTYLLLTIIFISMFYFIYTFNGNKLDQDDYYDISKEEIRFQILTQIQLEEIFDLENSFDLMCKNYTFLDEDKKTEFDYDTNCADYKIYLNHFSDLKGYLFENDSENFYRLKMFMLDVATDSFIDNFESLSDEMKVATEKRMIDYKNIKNIKDNIKANSADLEGFVINDVYRNNISKFNLRGLKLIESYNHYNNDYPLDVDYQVNAGFFIANYLDQYFILLIFITILLIFDSFYRDYKLGVIKNILIAPSNRYTYVILKITSTIISSLIIIIFPLIIFSIYLYFKVGYFGLNYPLYISQGATSRFKPYLEYSRIVGNEEKPINLYSTYTNICRYGPISQFPIDQIKSGFTLTSCDESIPFNIMKVMMLSEYLSLILIYFILVSIFISLLNSLLSVILNNRIFNLIILSSIIALGLILNKVLLGSEILKFLPTTFLSPTKVLMMTIPYTFLNGILVISLSIIILSILTYYFIQKKDFTY